MIEDCEKEIGISVLPSPSRRTVKLWQIREEFDQPISGLESRGKSVCKEIYRILT